MPGHQQRVLIVGEHADRAIVRRAAARLPIEIEERAGVPADLPGTRLVVLCGLEHARALATTIRAEHGSVAIVAALREGESPDAIAGGAVDDYVSLGAPETEIAARLAFAVARPAGTSQELESPLAEVARVSDDLIAISSADGSRNLYISAAYDAITGTSREEVLHDPARFLRLVHPDDHATLYAAHREREHPSEYQYRIVRPDGQIRWLRARVFPVPRERGAPPRLVTIARDVTDQKRAEDDAEAQRRLLEGVTRALTTLLASTRPSESIDAALAALGPATHVDRVYVAQHRRDADGLRVVSMHEWTSEGTARQLGRPEPAGEAADGDARASIEELERASSVELLRSEAPPALRAQMERTGARSTLIVPVFADGRCWGQVGFVDCHSERSWDASARAVLETTAAAVGSALTRERALDALAAQLHRIRSLYESTANPALSARAQLERLLAVGASLLGVGHVAVMRIRPEDVDCEVPYFHPPDSRLAGRRIPLERDVWVTAISDDRAVAVPDVIGTPIEDAVYRVIGMRAIIGSPIWVHGQPWGGLLFMDEPPRASPFHETDDDLVRLIARGVAHLIERMDAEQERRRLDASLRETQKLESLGLLAGGIAHDFNNLLMVIVGCATLAAREAPHDHPLLRESLDQICATARRAADLTRQLLAYAGRGQYRIEPVSLSALVADISALLAVVLPADARLEQRLDPELPAVMGDHAQLQQVVMNLITNAGEALEGRPGAIVVRARALDLPDGPPRARFVSEDAHAGHYVVLEVSDTGVGMASETIERMFDPFFTTKQTGRGLGLAAVLGVVRAHHGAIDVDSVPGGGTTFRVYLPAAAEPALEMLDVGSHPEGLLAARVLVVDDNEAVRTTVARILVAHGADVVTACDGIEAMEVVAKEGESLDAVVLDATMPRMDGARAREKMADLAPRLPVLVISGYAEGESVTAALRRPRTRFLQKPFGAADLVGAIRAMIEEAR